MKILIVTTELATDEITSGGLATFTSNIASLLFDMGHDVKIILATTKPQNARLYCNGDEIKITNIYIYKWLWNFLDIFSKSMIWISRDKRIGVRIGLGNIINSIRIRHIIKLIRKKEHVDIVHYCDTGSVSLFASRNVPYIVRCSGFLNLFRLANMQIYKPSMKTKDMYFREKLRAFCIKKAPKVVFPSELVARIAYDTWGTKSIIIESPYQYNVKKDVSIVDKYDLKNKKYIFHFGTLSYLKGTLSLAQISYSFLEYNPEYEIVLAGCNKEVTYNEKNISMVDLVKEQSGKYSSRIQYLGRLTRNMLYPVIQNSSVCILNSRIENLSNACIEAMSMGKIVIATEGASYEQLIVDGYNGFLCKIDDETSLLNKINVAIRMDDNEVKLMGDRAKETVKRLEPSLIAKKYEDLYKEVIANWNK